MFTRPRFRNYEPLVTTQIRLRNLIKLSGINLNCDDEVEEEDKTSMVYFTLHLSAFSKPIFTSEKVAMKKKVEWAEINCEQISTCPQKFVVIRVWKHCEGQQSNESSTATDQLLFLWGVYFTGLISISKQDEINFKDNTLLFHIFDDVFSSPDQIVIPNEISIICDQQQVGKYSSSPINSNNSSLNKEQSKKFYSNGAELSSDLSLSSEISSTSESLNRLKIKLRRSEFPQFEIQPSYTVSRLMKLQELQRRIKQKREDSKLLAERICRKSAACLNVDLIINRPLIYEPKIQPGMGKQLSRLLSQHPDPLKPEIILEIHDLRKKIELSKFRIKLLTSERDRYRLNNKNLEAKREKLKDENTENETMIWNSLRNLSRDNLKTHQEKLVLQRDVLSNVKLALGETKRCLLKELNEIYMIEKNEKGQYSINNIHLPDAESYADSNATPTQISIALGYVAHAVLIIARILKIPLRNSIVHEGSRSKIIDNIKILPPTDRVFPLFCRTMPPPNVLLYGVYLLNQNISQFKYFLGLSRGDLRATLANLWDIMNSNKCEMSPHFNDNFQSHRHNDCSTSSVDSVPLDIINVPTLSTDSSPRVSRSLDDFDEDLLNSLKTKFNSSAPDLTVSEPNIDA